MKKQGTGEKTEGDEPTEVKNKRGDRCIPAARPRLRLQ